MNKTIGIINSPTNQRVIQELRVQGVEVMLLPHLITRKTDISSDNGKFINDLANFDWLIFTDIFAVDYFVEELIEQDFDLYELDNLRICAFGEIVADRLRFSQIHSDVISRNLNPIIIIEDIKNYTASDNEKINTSFLIITAENDILKTSDELKKISKNLIVKKVYSTNIDELEDLLKIRILINSGAIDEVNFYSGEDLFDFLQIAGIPSLKDLSKQINFTSKNETILKSIEELKF